LYHATSLESYKKIKKSGGLGLKGKWTYLSDNLDDIRKFHRDGVLLIIDLPKQLADKILRIDRIDGIMTKEIIPMKYIRTKFRGRVLIK